MEFAGSSVTAEAPRATPTRRGFFWLTLYLGTLAALGPLAIDMYLPAFPRIAEAFGARVPDVQQTLASYFVGLALGQLFYGPLADRYGRKPALYLPSSARGVAGDCPSHRQIRNDICDAHVKTRETTRLLPERPP